MSDTTDPLFKSVPGPCRVDLENTLTLVERFRGGDQAAANELFARYEERIRRIVRVRLGPGLRRWVESGDLVQETCRAALQSLPSASLGTEFDLLDYLARVATNRIRDMADHLHAKKRDVQRLRDIASGDDEAAQTAEYAVDSQQSPSQVASRRELRELLDDVLATLPETYREVVLLRDYQAAEWTEVARLLQTPSVHAAQQLHQRAWIKIRLSAAPRLSGLRAD